MLIFAVHLWMTNSKVEEYLLNECVCKSRACLGDSV